VYTFNETGISRIYLEFFDTTGNRIAHKLRQANKKGSWTKLEVEQTCPWWASGVDVGLYSTGGNKGVAFYDDVSLSFQKIDFETIKLPPLKPGVKAMDIGTELQLFTDDRLIDAMKGVKLKLHRPRRGEIALAMDQPWEGVTSTYPVVIKDGDRYRMWYRAERPGLDSTAYAESTDGIHWERPSLGLVDFKGSKDNNLLWPTEGNSGYKMSVFLDSRPNVGDGERYKAIVQGPNRGGKRQAIYGLTSADGIHWRPFQKEPILVAPNEDPHFDSHNIAFWDEARNRYVAYTRGWRNKVRDIRFATSKDFKTWSPLQYIDMGDTPPEHLYTNAAHPYFRKPGFYIMLPSRFMHQRQIVASWPHAGISDVVLMTSHDGQRFERTFMEALIRPGLDANNWTDRGLYPGPSTVPIGPGDPPREMSFYYTENYRHRSNRIRRAILRVDGFASVHAGYPPGQFVTKPLVFGGKKLILNYATSAAGSIRVEILDADGEVVPVYQAGASEELYGDELAHEYGWASAEDLSPCTGEPVRLRFIMQDADLFSLRFSD